MNQILKSPEAITTGYSVFEKDQVLTHDQLNSVPDYFDDQTRLTRVKLLGVGIVCGLRVSMQADTISVTKGTGVTTDGDLLHFSADRVFDKFKPFDESNPAYGPFNPSKDTQIKIYELVGTADPRATALSQIAAQTGSASSEMVAVLFMESYVKDNDLCSGTDCDNLGKDFVKTIKLLLVAKSSVGLLGGTATTPADAFSALAEIVAERPAFNSSLTTPELLAAAYRSACDGIHNKLQAELAKIYPTCNGFLGEVFASDPMNSWRTRLNGFQSAFKANSGIQYYYDFLKDLVETYNAFRNLLFGENTWCCPGTDSFPKHLLLGNVLPGPDPDENRTGFYPSPVTSRTTGALEHAKFLAGKINTVIQAFVVPATTSLIETIAVPTRVSTVRITPSSTEERCLEERAIPYYYPIDNKHPVHKRWNYALHQRGMDAWNYSYNAALYHAQGGAAKPLASQIGRFSFFRIEGHLEQDVGEVITELERKIKDHNLPFVVRSVFLGTDKTKLVKKPGSRYGDLHRLHYLLRKDAAHQLISGLVFGAKLKDQVSSAPVLADQEAIDAKRTAAEKNSKLVEVSMSARKKLDSGYQAFDGGSDWETTLNATRQAAGEYKARLGAVTKTDFNTPLDSLIGNSHLLWLDWLPGIIADKEKQCDEKLLFGRFVEENPGIEHFAGVPRGGTFVLVYGEDKKVIADFMLDYRCVEDAEATPEEPPLVKPDSDPAIWFADNAFKIDYDWPTNAQAIVQAVWNANNAVTINASLDKHLDDFTKSKIDPKINFQKDYISLFRDVAGVFGNVKASAVTTGGAKYTDGLLAALADENLAKQKQVELLKERAIDPGQPQEKRDLYSKQAHDMEAELGNSAQKVAEYVATSRMEVTTGSEGHSAMLEVSKSYDMIGDAGTRNTVKTGLNSIKQSAENTGFKAVVGGIVEM